MAPLHKHTDAVWVMTALIMLVSTVQGATLIYNGYNCLAAPAANIGPLVADCSKWKVTTTEAIRGNTGNNIVNGWVIQNNNNARYVIDIESTSNNINGDPPTKKSFKGDLLAHGDCFWGHGISETIDSCKVYAWK